MVDCRKMDHFFGLLSMAWILSCSLSMLFRLALYLLPKSYFSLFL
jgi:hypothetical protein